MPVVKTGQSIGVTSGTCVDTATDPCLFFPTFDGREASHDFTVTLPTEIVAFGLAEGDSVVLEQANTRNGEYEPVMINGVEWAVTSRSNRALIPFFGRFRLFTTADQTEMTVHCNVLDCCKAGLHPFNGFTG